jgi:ubiquinone/menaquinone biosynthesis C-methylase UbiE
MSSTSLADRVAREHEAHTERDVLAESIRLKNKFPHLATYPSKQRLYAAIDGHTADLKGKTILDYGCGRGEMALKYLANGAGKVAAIDISNVYVEDLRQRARAAGIAEERCDFRAMDAHKLDFPDAAFDLVVGYGILHHLDPAVAFTEIHRVLKPNGRVLLQEPLADNPLLKLFRKLTPAARTEDEAPFTGKQVRALENQLGWRTESVYCGVLEMPLSLITSKLMPSRPNNFLLRRADQVEAWLHRRRWLLSWNQYIVFNLVKA